MTFRCGLTSGAAALLLIATAARTEAQTVSVGATASAAGHRLLGDRLVGPAVRVGFRFGQSSLFGRVGAERLTGSAWRTGVMCFGFVRPDASCPEEPVRDDAKLVAFSAGIGIQVLHRPRFSLDLIGDLRLASIEVEERGETTQRRQVNGENLRGGDVGIQAAWSPWRTLPVALEAGITAGVLGPVTTEEILDGYTPFQDGFGVTSLRIGVAWRLSR